MNSQPIRRTRNAKFFPASNTLPRHSYLPSRSRARRRYARTMSPTRQYGQRRDRKSRGHYRHMPRSLINSPTQYNSGQRRQRTNIIVIFTRPRKRQPMIQQHPRRSRNRRSPQHPQRTSNSNHPPSRRQRASNNTTPSSILKNPPLRSRNMASCMRRSNSTYRPDNRRIHNRHRPSGKGHTRNTTRYPSNN